MRLQWLVAMTMVLCAFAPGQDKFPMTCHPFQAIEVQHPIDSSCGLTGTGKGGSALQNQTKNNFCAGTTYQPITQQDILSKQAKVAALPGYLQWDQENMPASRAGFVSLGEGTAVQFVGYVVEAHYADLTSGESVNCEVKDDEASNDIHIALAPKPGVTNQCLSNSAEMVPHYRPASWNVTYLKKIGNSTLVRVSGQLMYDADHKICGEQGFTASDNPSRLSGWEIHPVYNFEVCGQQSGSTCSQWLSLSDWVASPAAKPKSGRAGSGSQRSSGKAAAKN